VRGFRAVATAASHRLSDVVVEAGPLKLALAYWPPVLPDSLGRQQAVHMSPWLVDFA
jgi:hypothetical protein